jgi:hypothetical protein
MSESASPTYHVELFGSQFVVSGRSKTDARHRAASKYKETEMSGPYIGQAVSELAMMASVEDVITGEQAGA